MLLWMKLLVRKLSSMSLSVVTPKRSYPTLDKESYVPFGAVSEGVIG